MKMLRYLAALVGLAGLVIGAPALAAPTWTQVNSWTPAGPVAAGAAGSTLQSGWIDVVGNQWSITASNQAVTSTVSAGTYLARPTSENKQDAQVNVCFVAPTNGLMAIYLRWNGQVAGNSTRAAYSVGINGPSKVWVAYAITNNTSTTLTVTGAVPTLTAGTTYCFIGDAYQNGSSTALDLKVTSADGSTTLGTGTATDSTAALQNIAGQLALVPYQQGSASDVKIVSVATYANQLPASTAYTISGPSSGASGVASSSFTVLSNGSLASAVTVSLADNDNGVFSPATVTLPANSSAQSSATFTYTPGSTGPKTLTGTNNGGLTNGSATYQSLTTVSVSSAAFHFSPANWWGDTGRGGSLYRAATFNGAYFAATWTASASPSAVLHLTNASSNMYISFYLNGVLTDNIAANGDITLTSAMGLVPSATNTLKVYLRRNSVTCKPGSPAASGWNAPTNAATVQVGGLYLDVGSTPGVAPAPTKWVAIIGDSITMGWVVEGNATSYTYDNAIKAYSFYVGRALEQAGYDYSIQAGSGDGFVWQGCGTALYATSSGTYNDAVSRWNKVNANLSMLDSNGHLSAYGSTGTEPSAIFVELGTNEAFNSVSSTDITNSMKGLFAAYRSVAPATPVVWNVPFQLSPSYPAYYTYLKNGFAAYKSAAPSDALTTQVDYGSAVAKTMSSVGLYSTDGTHPNALGAPWISAPIIGTVMPLLTPATGGTIQCNGAKSCAIVAGSNLAGG